MVLQSNTIILTESPETELLSKRAILFSLYNFGSLLAASLVANFPQELTTIISKLRSLCTWMILRCILATDFTCNKR